MPGLDLLRGIAILGVILNHTGQGFSSGQAGLTGAALFGTYGVQLFFLVSALTMCHMWHLREAEPQRVLRFYLRRFFRIAPLFWLAIPVYLLLFGLGQRYQAPEGIQPHQVLATLFFLHGFWRDTMNSVVPGGWSIAVEMSFYAVFPLIATRLRDRRARYLGAAMALWLVNAITLRDLISGFLAQHFVSPNPQLVGDFLYLNIINQAPVFLLGCYLYHAIARAPTRMEWLALAVWVVVAWGAKTFHGIEGFGFLLICGALAAIAYVCMRAGLRFPLLERLGRHSYAIYLSHFMVLYGLEHWLPHEVGVANFLLLVMLTTLASYLIALVAYALVEQRVQAWVESLIGRTPQPIGAAR